MHWYVLQSLEARWAQLLGAQPSTARQFAAKLMGVPVYAGTARSSGPGRCRTGRSLPFTLKRESVNADGIGVPRLAEWMPFHGKTIGAAGGYCPHGRCCHRNAPAGDVTFSNAVQGDTKDPFHHL